MVLYLLIAAAAVAAAAVVNKTEGMGRGSRGMLLQKTCLCLIALILILPAVLRQETGNDYLRYVEFFHLASIDAYVPTEAGFNWLAKLLYGLCGYENYLLIFAVYAVLTILLMLAVIRRQAENFCFSFFLFMMFGYYYQSFNTMRYYFALSLALAAMTCLLRKNYAGFVALVLLASLFHKSALVTIVLYPLAMHRWRKGELAAGAALGMAVLLFHEKALNLLLALYPSWAGTVDLAAGTSVSWVNIARCMAVLLLALLVQRRTEERLQSEKAHLFRGESLKVTSICHFQTAASVLAHRLPHSAKPFSRILPQRGIKQRKPAQKVTEENILETAQTDSGEKRKQEKTSRTQSAAGRGAVLCERELTLYRNSTYFGLLLYVFGWFVPEISRICYYLTFTQIFYLPMLLARIPEEGRGRKEKRLLTVLVILAAMLFFALFLRTAYRDTIKILPYKSFLFHDLNRTPSASVGGK